MKHIYPYLFVSLIILIGKVNAQSYCVPEFQNSGCEVKITSVTSAVVPGLSQVFDTCNTAGYVNLSQTPVETYYGLTIDLSVQLEHALGSFPKVKAFIDLNGDGDFTDAQESRSLSALTSTSFLGVITIPLGAGVGVKRLRIRAMDVVPAGDGACASADWGSAVDLAVEIKGVSGNLLPACVNAATISPENASNNSCFTGLTLKWDDVWSNNPDVLDSLYYNIAVIRKSTQQEVWSGNTFESFVQPDVVWERSTTYQWIVSPGNTFGVRASCDTFEFTMPNKLDPEVQFYQKEVGACLDVPYLVTPSIQFGTSPLTYTWTGTGKPFLDDHSVGFPNFFPDATGEYTLSLKTVDANGCSSQDTVVITADLLPEYGDVGILSDLLCPGEKVGVMIEVISGEPSLVSEYQTQFESLSATKDVDTLYALPKHEAQTLYVALANGMCVDTIPVGAVFVSPESDSPKVSFLDGDATACSGTAVTLGVENYSSGIVWNDENATQSAVVEVRRTGNYRATYTDGYGCKFLSAKKKVTFKNYKAPVITQLGNACFGDTITLKSSVSNVTWSDASGTQGPEIQVLNPGTFTCHYENAYCSKESEEFAVSFMPYPSKPGLVKSRSDTVCEGIPVFLYTNSPYDVQWSNGGDKTEIIAQASGLYSLYAVNDNGCKTYSDTIEVYFHPLPMAPEITHESETLLVDDGYSFYKWYGPNGIVPFTENWMVANEVGNYYVVVTDEKGCVAEPSEDFLFNPSSVVELENTLVKAYPNPSNGVLFVENETDEFMELGVYDVNGRLVHLATVYPNHKKQLNLDLENGTYILKNHTKPLHFHQLLQIQK